MTSTTPPTKNTEELERGIDVAILLRTKIRNTLYNNDVGFSMANAGGRTAEKMAGDLVEKLAVHAEKLIARSVDQAVQAFGEKVLRELDDGKRQHSMRVIRSVITSLLKGAK